MNMNMYVYRVTEKPDSESVGEPGEPFEAFNLSVQLERGEAHLNAAAAGQGERARPGGSDQQATRCLNQRCKRKMDG